MQKKRQMIKKNQSAHAQKNYTHMCFGISWKKLHRKLHQNSYINVMHNCKNNKNIIMT